LANRFEAQKHGSIAVITSVAGDRGRQSNYVYGTAKGAVTIFLQGLRNRLHKSGVQVLTIKPGFVDTPMTAGIKKGPLWASPDTIASAIVRSMETRRDVVYTPWFWLEIMAMVRMIPEKIFKSMRL
jgi:short-subunit dehydrogenase